MQVDLESHQFWYNLSGNEKEARLSTKMVPQAKKEAPASSKGKAKALKAKKGSVKWHPQPQREEDPFITQLPVAQDPAAPEAAQILSKDIPKRNKLDHYGIIKFPLITESAMKKTEDKSTLVFSVAVKTIEHQINQAVTNL
ncbi:60S ribosomal protein L23a-like [Peromyscus californicus insignis]|uniref:60S ribosomal protein L23a-like n=1 Tax=Peromyscus californicus insignis TaxID=564181 RepID=UPI0022A665FF|nr:60S ribosomal protein L23a-like [Peromyscus californicus insignis]